MTALRKDAEMVKLFDADGDGHVTPTEVPREGEREGPMTGTSSKSDTGRLL